MVLVTIRHIICMNFYKPPNHKMFYYIYEYMLRYEVVVVIWCLLTVVSYCCEHNYANGSVEPWFWFQSWLYNQKYNHIASIQKKLISFIHSGYFYRTSFTTWRCSRLQLCHCVGVNTPKCYRQLWVKDLPKVPMWRLEWDSNLRPSGHKASNLPLSHHAPLMLVDVRHHHVWFENCECLG